MNKIIPNVDVLLGMDVIKALGGVLINDEGVVQWVRKKNFAMAAKVANSKEKQLDDEDFQANFDGSSWNAEVREWIDAGVLVEHDPVIHGKYEIMCF